MLNDFNCTCPVYIACGYTDLRRGINYRMHDKYMIVDDRMYILGGRNINDNFLGTPKEDSSIDRELLVYNTGNNTGASYLQLKAYFTEIWNEP